MYPQFSNTLSTPTGSSPSDSPLQGGNRQALANIDNSFSAYSAAPGLAAAAGVTGVQAGINDQASAQAIGNQIKSLQDMQNPSKYKQAPSPDGGYNFFDPTGKPINVSQYASVVGKDPSAILKGSQNPADQQYVNDFTNLEKLMNLVQNTAPGDKKAETSRDQFAQQVGGQSLVDLLHNGQVTPHDLIGSFQQYYGNIYGGGNQPGQHGAGNFAPATQYAPAVAIDSQGNITKTPQNTGTYGGIGGGYAPPVAPSPFPNQSFQFSD